MPKWLSAPCASQFIDFTGKGNKNDKNRWMQDRLSWNLTWLFKKPLSNESLQSHLEHQMKCPPLIHRPKPGVWSYRRTCPHSPPTSYSGGKRSREKGDGSRLRGPAGETRTHTDADSDKHTWYDDDAAAYQTEKQGLLTECGPSMTFTMSLTWMLFCSESSATAKRLSFLRLTAWCRTVRTFPCMFKTWKVTLS